jgi:hypothetical protein
MKKKKKKNTEGTAYVRTFCTTSAIFVVLSYRYQSLN